MAREECSYCENQDIKDAFGVQWTSGATFDTYVDTLIVMASRLIDREMGWGDCHYAILDTLASARFYDTIGGLEIQIDRCLDDGFYYTVSTISFVAPNLINDSAGGLALFVTGDVIAVSGSALNDGVYTVVTGGVGAQIVVILGIVLEAAGASITISRPAVAVDENADGIYTAWAGLIDYFTRPYNKTYFTRIVVKSDASKIFPVGQRLLRVSAKWGAFGTPPQEIQQACIITVSRWFKRGLQQYQDTGAIIEVGQLTYTKALDPDVVEILRVADRRIHLG